MAGSTGSGKWAAVNLMRSTRARKRRGYTKAQTFDDVPF
nr:MAG TPA: Helicase HerA, central domain [Caudoviricetes sp.]